jgi:hypothetical protein
LGRELLDWNVGDEAREADAAHPRASPFEAPSPLLEERICAGQVNFPAHSFTPTSLLCAPRLPGIFCGRAILMGCPGSQP